MVKKKIDENIKQRQSNLNEIVDKKQKSDNLGATISMQDISKNTVDMNEAVYMPHELTGLFQEYRTGFNLEYQVMTGRLDLIVKYRNISLFPEVMTAIDEIVTSAIVMTNNKPFELCVDEIFTHRDVRNGLLEQFNQFMMTQNIKNNIYEIFEQWFVDGILYIWKRRDPQTKKMDYYIIDPLQIRLEVNRWVVAIPSLIQQSPISMMFQPGIQYSSYDHSLTVEIPFEEISVYYSGKFHNRIPIGYLHKALKSANQLNLLKDALLIYRLSRSAEKFVFYIDVGQIPKKDAEAYLNKVANQYRNQKYYNPATGDIDGKTAIQSMLHSYFIARQEGKTTEITTVGGNIQLGDVEDFKIFINELYKSLYVPRTRMAMTTEESGTHGLANNIQEIQIEEKRFFKFLQRVRNHFGVIFIDMFRDFLVERGFCTPEQFETYRNFISLKFYNDIEVEKLMAFGNLQLQLDVLTKLKDFTALGNQPYFFSSEWIFKNVFNWSDSEVANMNKGILSDMDNSLYNSKGKTPPMTEVKPTPQPFSDVDAFDIKKLNKDSMATDYTKAFLKTNP